MDLNLQYADHQRAMMSARDCISPDERRLHLDDASRIANGISAFQLQLGAAASCAWSASLLATNVGA